MHTSWKEDIWFMTARNQCGTQIYFYLKVGSSYFVKWSIIRVDKYPGDCFQQEFNSSIFKCMLQCITLSDSYHFWKYLLNQTVNFNEICLSIVSVQFIHVLNEYEETT